VSAVNIYSNLGLGPQLQSWQHCHGST